MNIKFSCVIIDIEYFVESITDVLIEVATKLIQNLSMCSNTKTS